MLKAAQAHGGPPALVRRADGRASRLESSSPLLGAFESLGYCDEGFTLATGDVLLLYTDGVLECAGPRGQFGEDRLLSVVSDWKGSPEGLPAHVVEAVQSHCEGLLSDDMAVVAIART